MEELLANGKKVLAAQAFSRLLGAELTEFSEELTELMAPITDQIKQQNGYVHGGVTSYLADNALTFAGGAVLGAPVVTSEFKINYLKTAKGEKLIARASVLHVGKTQAVCRCEIYSVGANGTEVLCAAAQGTIVKIPTADQTTEKTN